MNHFKWITCFVILLVENKIVLAQDRSALYIDLLTENPPNLSMIISDHAGRKTGVKEFVYGTRNGIVFEEIPNSYQGYEGSPDDDLSNKPATTGRIMIGLTHVSQESYYLLIFGSSNTTYGLNIRSKDFNGKRNGILSINGFITNGTTNQFNLSFDPTPGAPAPVIKKEVTFQLLRDDINAAYKLNQIGEEKFANSLIKMINMAEKIYDKCEKTDKKDGEKNKKCYRPAMSVLSMFVKRLEIANKKCDKSAACDEEKEWNNFHNKYVKDKDLKEFFSEWEKDEWHKYKKSCKRYVSDEALDIISSDVNWYVKGIGEEAWSEYKKEHKPYISNKQKQIFK